MTRLKERFKYNKIKYKQWGVAMNKSFTKFTVQDKKIRFGLGSIKNVGIWAIETVISEREKNTWLYRK